MPHSHPFIHFLPVKIIPGFASHAQLPCILRVFTLSLMNNTPTILVAVLVHQLFKRDERASLSRIIRLLFVLPTFVSICFGDKSTTPFFRFSKTLGIFYLSLVISIVSYRLSSWHPLARYPGPLLCKISKLYWATLTQNGQQHKMLGELHKKYGDIVRIGPNEVSITDVSALDPLMGPAGHPKGQFWEGRFPAHTPVLSVVGLRDKKEHMRRRRAWTRALTPAALKNYERFIIARATQVTEALAKHTKETLYISDWIGYFSFDCMSDLVFGEGPEMIENGDRDNLWHLLEGSQRPLFFMGLVPWLGKQLFRIPNILPGVTKYRDYAFSRTIKRKQQGSGHKDLFYYLMDEDGELDRKPTNAEVLSDGSLAIIAGADTSNSVLSNALYFLMKHPKVLERLRKELDHLECGLMNAQKQAQLTYLNAVISETLRLYPPTMSGSQREIKGTAIIGPYPLPEGTATSIPFYLLQRDPRNFAPYPDSFIPERWLPAEQREILEPEIFNDKETYRLNQIAFTPFSYGPASCVGKQLAWIEMRMFLCALLNRFNVNFAPGYDVERWEQEICDYYIMSKGKLPTILTARK